MYVYVQGKFLSSESLLNDAIHYKQLYEPCIRESPGRNEWPYQDIKYMLGMTIFIIGKERKRTEKTGKEPKRTKKN